MAAELMNYAIGLNNVRAIVEKQLRRRGQDPGLIIGLPKMKISRLMTRLRSADRHNLEPRVFVDLPLCLAAEADHQKKSVVCPPDVGLSHVKSDQRSDRRSPADGRSTVTSVSSSTTSQGMIFGGQQKVKEISAFEDIPRVEDIIRLINMKTIEFKRKLRSRSVGYLLEKSPKSGSPRRRNALIELDQLQKQLRTAKHQLVVKKQKPKAQVKIDEIKYQPKKSMSNLPVAKLDQLIQKDKDHQSTVKLKSQVKSQNKSQAKDTSATSNRSMSNLPIDQLDELIQKDKEKKQSEEKNTSGDATLLRDLANSSLNCSVFSSLTGTVGTFEELSPLTSPVSSISSPEEGLPQILNSVDGDTSNQKVDNQLDSVDKVDGDNQIRLSIDALFNNVKSKVSTWDELYERVYRIKFGQTDDNVETCRSISPMNARSSPDLIRPLSASPTSKKAMEVYPKLKRETTEPKGEQLSVCERLEKIKSLAPNGSFDISSFDFDSSSFSLSSSSSVFNKTSPKVDLFKLTPDIDDIDYPGNDVLEDDATDNVSSIRSEVEADIETVIDSNTVRAIEDPDEFNKDQVIESEAWRIYALRTINGSITAQMIKNLEPGYTSKSPNHLFYGDLVKELAMDEMMLADSPPINLKLPLNVQRTPWPKKAEEFAKMMIKKVNELVDKFELKRRTDIRRDGLVNYCRRTRNVDLVDQVLWRELVVEDPLWQFLDGELEVVKQLSVREESSSKKSCSTEEQL